MERAYLGVSREILVILRLSVADVTTLCLSFKNCTVAIYYYIFFPSILSSGSGAVALNEEHASTYFFTPPKGGFLVVFRIWHGTITRIIGHSNVV